MSLYTYLRIKQAASTSEDVYRASMRALENSDRAADYKNQLDALHGNYDKANAEIDRLQGLVDNGDAERLRLIRENSDLQSQYDDFYGKTKAYEDQAKREADNYRKEILGLKGQAIDYQNQIDELNEELKYQKGNRAWQTEMYNELQARNKATNKQLTRSDAKNKGRANTIKRQAEQIANQRNMLADEANTIDRMRRNASIGGAVGGAAIGGGAGYMGSKWLANKLKLTGRKALAAKLLGTAAGSALGGAGGYYLGQNI